MSLSKMNDFRVIGAGLSRTGTMSLKAALEILLPGKCHHGMKAHLHENEWYEFFAGRSSDHDLKRLLLENGYSATVDVPLNYHYERLMEIFPDAKVVLTVRDPEAWYNSLIPPQQMYSNCPVKFFLRFRVFDSYLNTLAAEEDMRGYSHKMLQAVGTQTRLVEMLEECKTKEYAAEYFRKWNQEVEGRVPKDKLLIFQVKEGWEPLCKHLGVPVPDVPFPCVNSSSEFWSYIRRNKRRSWLLLYEMITIPLLVCTHYWCL